MTSEPSPPRPARRRLIAATAIVVVAAIVAVGFWLQRTDQRARLSFGGESQSPFGIETSYAGNERPWSFGGLPLCSAKPAHVVLDRLVPVGGNGGLRIVAIATRPHTGKPAGQTDLSFGSSQRDLVIEGFSPTQPPLVDATCPPSWSAAYPGRVIYDELGVQVQRTVPGDGTFTSLRVDYTVDGHHGHLTIPWALMLCGPHERTSAACPPPPSPDG
jgi:hypothetical protein